MSSFEVCLRYGLQRNLTVIPKSTSFEHLKENYNIWKSMNDETKKLTENEMTTIDKLNKNHRFITLQRDEKSPQFPFYEPF